MTRVKNGIRTSNTGTSKKRERFTKKLRALRPMEYEYAELIHNLSKHQLLLTRKFVLVSGLKFNYTNARSTNFVTSFEAGIRRRPLNEDVWQQLARHRQTHVIQDTEDSEIKRALRSEQYVQFVSFPSLIPPPGKLMVRQIFL